MPPCSCLPDNDCFAFTGKSPYKNTQPILEAWARNPDFPPLTISTYDKDTITLVKQFLEGRRDLGYIPLNIRLVDTRMSVQQLNGLLRGVGIHVCPSQKEGFGHYINQARAAEALVLTTGRQTVWACSTQKCMRKPCGSFGLKVWGVTRFCHPSMPPLAHYTPQDPHPRLSWRLPAASLCHDSHHALPACRLSAHARVCGQQQ